MGLAFVRPFIRLRMQSLGYIEHNEPFDPGQVGANIVDDSFHLETGVITSGSANQNSHQFNFPFTIRIYKIGYSNILDAYDNSHEIADIILSDLLNPVVRLDSGEIKDIVPNSIQPTRLSTSNDNVIVIELVFTAKLELCF